MLSSSLNRISSDNSAAVSVYRKKLAIMKKVRTFIFIVILCVCISFSVCYVVNRPRDTTPETHSELCVFKLDQTKLNSLVNSSYIPFVDTNCDSLSYNTQDLKFEVKMSGSFELSLSVALQLNNNLGRSALMCIDYNLSNDKKRLVCSRAQCPSNDSNSAVITLETIELREREKDKERKKERKNERKKERMKERKKERKRERKKERKKERKRERKKEGRKKEKEKERKKKI
ncbi:Hypothetical predicted protein [Mytilus galloprovincialis]|uniref:Uncharacterized protein n=1 Tax=Mytilus galloprovincialis TaxID=29158 RepID=A0A8B6EDK5_MYTGA|nr:Hypothetical predicted protein [Mytilus galloprovincialis]